MRAFSLADKLVLGFMILIGMAETGHLMMVFGHRPFSDVVILFEAEAAVAVIVCAGITIWRKVCRSSGSVTEKHSKVRKNRRGQQRDSARSRSGGFQGKDCTAVFVTAFLAFALLVLYQIMTIVSENSIDHTGDLTVELVTEILGSDSIYQVNPLTGQSYTAGVPLRIRILGLPTFYAVLCRVFGIPAWELVEKWVPVAGLLLSYLAFGTLAKAVFPERKAWEKRMIFLALTAAVLCVGDYAYGMDGFGMLYCGYRGTTLRATILLPYTFGLALRHKWKESMLCVLAEACIVWTLYGMGMCLVVIVGMGAVRFLQKRRSEGFLEAGREA